VQRLGKYTNLELVGQGTMGVVYRAEDESLGAVAIKVMAIDQQSDPRAYERFMREARVAASLHHPNIIDIHGMGEENGRPYIVMEFLEGESLKAVIRRGDEVPLERCLDLMKQVSRALAYAHEAGVAHRDIKPDNIFVTRDGDVRILDFGIARIQDSNLTATGVALGTPAYMSPEQVLGEKVDRRSDVFGAGAVFYELLSGERAFPGKRVDEIFDEIMRHRPPPIHRHNERLPASLSAIVDKALAKAPEQRYQSMDELLAHLDSFDGELAKLRDRVRREAEAGLARLADLTAGGGQPAAAIGGGDAPLPDGYFELLAFVGGLAEEHAHTDAVIGELQWVEEATGASFGEYSDGGLRHMANRVDEIRDVCPENSGVKRLGRRLLDELKARLTTSLHLTTLP